MSKQSDENHDHRDGEEDPVLYKVDDESKLMCLCERGRVRL